MKNKSLTYRIFINTFLVGTLVYFICAFLFISNMYGYFETQIFNQLETECNFLEKYVLNNEINEILKLKTKNRITLIHSDGTVFFDNSVNVLDLENHSTRIEFINAKNSGFAKNSRFSSTMLKKTLYFAKLLSNGDIIRISCNQYSVWILIFGMSQTLIFMFLVAIIISAFSANWMSKKITEPLEKIDLENPENCEIYEELKPFTKRIAEENFEKLQREELRQQFSANVSHELKTPLTSISGFAEILKNGGIDEKTVKDFASTIFDETQRMITLVNDIIKLSKLDEKSICLQKESLNLKEICSAVMQNLLVSAKKKNILLNLSGENAIIYGVQPVIYEMVYNLVDNAIKYSNPNVEGKIEINVSTNNLNGLGGLGGNLKNDLGGGLKECRQVILTVQYNGIGIPATEKERIFERFYCIDKSRSKQNGGTGLGLSIVKHAAKYHNANILLTSEVGKGSIFTIIFNG